MKSSPSIRQLVFWGFVLWFPILAPAQLSGPVKAVSFDGVNGYATVPATNWFTGNFTIEGWVYVRSYNNWSRLLDFGNGANANEVYLALSYGTGGVPVFGILTSGEPGVVASQQIPTNQWVHLAATFNGTTGTIYLNGVNVGSGPLNVPNNVLRTLNYIGRSQFAGDAYANASFDEIRIWNVAKTQSQIQANMRRSLVGNEAGLVGYWRFDEGSDTSVADATGKGNPATLVGGASWTNSAAQITSGAGGALLFNTSALGGVTHQPALNAYPLTIMTWFKSTNGGGALVNKYASSSGNGYNLFIPGSGNLLGWYFRDNANNIIGSLNAGFVADGKWHHAAMVVDAAGGRLYLDGVQKVSQAWTGTPGAPTTTQNLWFNHYPGDSLGTAQIDETSVWNTNLSTAEIQQYMTNTLAGAEPGLLGYWRMDEGSGTNVVDSSGHGYNATLSGNPTWTASGVPIAVPDPAYAINLTGTNSEYVQVPSGVWFGDNFTVESWVYIRSHNSNARLFDFGNGSADNNYSLSLSSGTTGRPVLSVYYNSSQTAVQANSALPLNQWVHIACTKNGYIGTIYINGVSVVSSSSLYSSLPTVVRTNNYIGRSNFGDPYANVTLDEFRIWNVTRTQAQIQQGMTNFLTGSEASLLAYYRFDEGSGTNLVNATGSGTNAWLASVSGTSFPAWTRSTVPPSSSTPSVTTLAASNVSPYAATLNSSVTPSALGAQTWFQWGTTTNYGATTPAITLAATNTAVTTNSSVNLPTPLTLYHFRAVAGNAFGVSYGLDQTFTTPISTNANLAGLGLNAGTMSPAFNAATTNYSVMLTNGTASTITLTAARADAFATLNMRVNGGSFTPITSGQGVGLTLDFGTNTVDVQVIAQDAATTNTYTLTIVRVIAQAVVTTQPPSIISSNAVTLNATITPSGSPTLAWFEWGPTTSYGNSTTTQDLGFSGTISPSQILNGLAPGTFYNYRAIATNAGGIIYGSNQVFHTSGMLFVVTNSLDGATGSLRSQLANAVSGDFILITNVGIYFVTNGPLTITTNVTIIGPGAQTCFLNANGNNRVFVISPGITASLSGLGIFNGRAPSGTTGSAGSAGYTYTCGFGTCYQCPTSGGQGGPGSNGGGIFNQGTLQLTDCWISGNSAGSGGPGGPAGAGGGCGVSNGSIGLGGNGGGIYSSGTLIMQNCTVSFNLGGSGPNGANGTGAGMMVAGTTFITNCTFYQNISSNNSGGAIYNSGQLTTIACTLTANLALNGPGIFNSGTATLRNTVVGDNYGPTNFLFFRPDLSGSFSSLGFNCISRIDGSSGLSGIGDSYGYTYSPRYTGLSSLANNGGPTPTCQPGSALIDYGSSGTNSLLNSPYNLAKDQRGRPRQFGYATDIGAVESQPGTPSVTTLSVSNWTLNARIFSAGAATTWYFQIGTDTNYGIFSATNSIAAGLMTTPSYSAVISGLLPETLYHYRAVIANAADTFKGQDLTFTISTNATLSTLSLSSGPFAPAFDPTTASYTITSTSNSPSLTVTATVAQSNAVCRVRINGGTYMAASSGSPSALLPLWIGTNTIEVQVTAQDAITTMTYLIALVWSPTATPPQLVISQPTNSPLVVQFSGDPGMSYTVERSVNLKDWIVVTNLLASSVTNFQFNIVTTNAPIDDPAFNTMPLTILAWLNTTQTSGGGGIVNKYSSSSNNGYQLFLIDGHVYAWYFGAGGNIYNNGILDGGLVSDGQWHHLALVVDPSSGRLYVDGILKQTVAWAGTPAATTTITPLQFGIYPGTFDALSHYSGLLDEVSIWNAGLDTNQIQSSMNQSLSGTETNLLGYWRMNEGHGSLANDLSSRGNPARLINGVSWTPSGAPITGGAGSALSFDGTNQSATVNNLPYPPMMFYRVRFP